MDAIELAIAHPKLLGYQLGSDYYIFAADNFKASYWLLLRREGFSAN